MEFAIALLCRAEENRGEEEVRRGRSLPPFAELAAAGEGNGMPVNGTIGRSLLITLPESFCVIVAR